MALIKRFPHSRRNTLVLTLVSALTAAAVLSSGFLGCGGNRQPPVVVIGLDGADFDLLVPWMEQGELPHLKAFLESSVLGELEVVYPILSPVCWTSAATGVNPGKHGIFDFQKPAPNGEGTIIETATHRRALTIWQLLSDAGYRVGVMNVPMTYPPDPVRGKMISGFPFPSGDVNFTYPPELQNDLGDYPLDYLGMKVGTRSSQEKFADFLKGQRERARVAKDWLTSGEFDFVWVVFTGPDKVQHFFWQDMDEQHPRHSVERAKIHGNSILELWQKQDAVLGDLLATLPEDATVLMLSDHGFDAIYRQVNMVPWVAQTDIPEWLDTHSIPPIMITNGILHYILDGPLAGSSDREAFIDLFIERARGLKDPLTQSNPFENLYRREEIYSGRMTEKGPDIVIQEIPKYYVTTGTVDSTGTPADIPVFMDLLTPGFSAHHRPEGILAIRGPGVRLPSSGTLRERLEAGGDFENAQILDISPTLLALMGQTIPEAMDGRVLVEAVDDAYLAEHPPDIREVEGFLLDRIPETELTPEQIESMKALPYIQ